jgi:uncharacterized membrane protein YphA (DoxX/SURF4 family)
MTTIQQRWWHAGLWILQVLLAAMFLMAGFMKTFTPVAELSQSFPALSDLPLLVRFIGISELAGGLGLLLPAGLKIFPRLTPAAAYALSFVMLLALLFHLFRAEYSAIPMNAALGAMAVMVGWGRTFKAPVSARPIATTARTRND